MTRFQQEISGMLGDWWKGYAEKEVLESIEYADKNAHVEDDGALRWDSGNYVPDDFCERLEYGGYAFDREATKAKRDVQQEESIRRYKESMKNHVYSDDEMFEMRSAFGTGTVVVDAITGKKIKL